MILKVIKIYLIIIIICEYTILLEKWYIFDKLDSVHEKLCEVWISIAILRMLRAICELRVGVAIPKPYLLPSIFSSSLNIHTLSHTPFSRTFRFHPPSTPLTPFLSLLSPKPPKAAGTHFLQPHYVFPLNFVSDNI